jgi:phosphoesterase RecJ-like protein
MRYKDMIFDEMKQKIDRAETIAVLTHENPDGDAIGSGLAVYWALKNMGKKVDFIVPVLPNTFKKLPGADEIKEEGSVENYDLAIAVDAATIERLSTWGKYLQDAKESFVIDHHESHINYCDIDYVEPVSPATCETLVAIFKAWNVEFTKEVASALLCGLITDTGGFQYQTVTKYTFDCAGEMVEAGADLTNIYRQVFETKSRAAMELQKRALDRMEYLEDGKVCYTYTSLKDEEETEADPGDYEGIVSIGRSVEGVEVSVYIREIGDDFYKISTRSNEYVNVSEVCSTFGGGGHIRAAGAKVNEKLEDIKEKILAEIRKQL